VKMTKKQSKCEGNRVMLLSSPLSGCRRKHGC